MKYFFLPLICYLFCASCVDGDEICQFEKSAKCNLVTEEEARIIADNFFTSVPSLSENDKSTRMVVSNTSNQIPIKYKGEVVYWVVNSWYGGYVILSADKRFFPVFSYSDKGTFNYNALSSVERAEFDSKSADAYERMHQNVPYDQSWATIVGETPAQKESDSTYVVSYEFYPAISTDPSTRMGGSIPDRANANGYKTILPLLNQNRKWKMWWPYTCDMPHALAQLDPYFPDNTWSPYAIQSLTIALARLFDYYPNANLGFWGRQPNAISEGKSCELTRRLADIDKNLGTDYSQYQTYLPTRILANLPALVEKYGFYMDTKEEYKADRVSVDRIRNELELAHRPVLYVPVINKKRADGIYWMKSCVIDGYHEMRVKVTVKTYFLGILFKTKVYYRYQDYFHYVYAYGQLSEWGVYDLNRSIYNNVYTDYFYAVCEKSPIIR